MAEKPWGGRFPQEVDRLVEGFTASIDLDRRLYKHDIAGSIAYAEALAKAGVITHKEAQDIIKALKEIKKEIEDGTFTYSPRLEDIHMHIEARLIEKVGEIGGKLHTGRSRNDQVSLDLRLYLKEETGQILELIKRLQRVIVELAERHLGIIMPGYTHLRRAQPILLAHHLMSYYEQFKRDGERFTDAMRRIDYLPLGSGALAGTPYPIDQSFLAQRLGFSSICHNSIDAVSDRDFVVEFLFCCSLLMMHTSRLCEDLILWSTNEFGYVRLPLTFCTGSSIMPQKANPDVLELIRGKTGRVYAALISLLVVLKALPHSYNRDLQEDKFPLFDTIDTVKGCLTILPPLLNGIEVDAAAMRRGASAGYVNATDLADYLVAKGVPFREAHQITGKVVLYAEGEQKGLEALTLEELRIFSPLFSEDVYDYIRIENAVNRRQSIGGTASEQVVEQIKKAKEELS